MQFKTSAAASVVLICALLTTPQATAAETTWPLEGPAETLLAYGETYHLSTIRTHSGVDLGAVAGEGVSSPCAGRVTFSGSVPAADGGTCLAVSIALDDGRTMTFMPLSSTTVTPGQSVGSSEVIGTLAATGDPSSLVSHLHIGLRRGESYLDPMTFLRAPLSAGPPPEPQCEPLGDSAEGASPSAPGPVTELGATAAAAPILAGTPQPTRANAGQTPGSQAVLPDAAPHPVPSASVPQAPANALTPTEGHSRTTPAAAAANGVAHLPSANAQMPAGVSIARLATGGSDSRQEPGGASVQELPDSRAAVWSALMALARTVLDIGVAGVLELGLVMVGVAGAAYRNSLETARSDASVRPVGQPIAAAADRCYTRRAHFLPRAQPSQSRGRIVQRR